MKDTTKLKMKKFALGKNKERKNERVRENKGENA